LWQRKALMLGSFTILASGGRLDRLRISNHLPLAYLQAISVRKEEINGRQKKFQVSLSSMSASLRKRQRWKQGRCKQSAGASSVNV